MTDRLGSQGCFCRLGRVGQAERPGCQPAHLPPQPFLPWLSNSSGTACLGSTCTLCVRGSGTQVGAEACLSPLLCLVFVRIRHEQQSMN